MAQGLYLLESAADLIQAIGEKDYQIPLIVGGDYNSRPSSSVQSLLHYDESIAEPSWENRWSLDMIEKEFVQEAAFPFFAAVHKRFLSSKIHFQ